MSDKEGLFLNGVDLNDGPAPGVFALESLDAPPPSKRIEWVKAADADGAILPRTPHFENRTVTVKVRVEPQPSMDEALTKLGLLVDQIQEAEKNPTGIPLEWTPANSSKTITFYVLTGEVTGLPIQVEGDEAGWFQASPIVTLKLECLPFGYGEEVTTEAVELVEGQPILTLTVADVAGDVPAEGALLITDTAGVGRRTVEWGLEQRYYDASTSLLLDSEDMEPVAGDKSTAVGGYERPGATTKTIATELLMTPTTCCSTGSLEHVGTFRVKARAYLKLGSESELANVYLRLGWQEGEGPFHANEWQQPILGNCLVEVDLGMISISPTRIGSQKWSGRIEAYSQNAILADTLHVDYLDFIPVAEGYGVARGAVPEEAGNVVAFDNFTTGTLSGNLSGRTAAVGGTWTTSGATTDFAVAKGHISRTTTKDTEPRFALLGSELKDCAVKVATPLESFIYGKSMVVGRYVNSSNYAFACASPPYNLASLGVVIGGETTMIGVGRMVGLKAIRLECRSDGSIAATFEEPNKGIRTLSGSHSSLRAGGTLAKGRCGLGDEDPTATATTRVYFTLSVTSLPSVPYCVEPSQSLSIGSDVTLLEDSTGTYWGAPPEYRGSRFLLPQAGEAQRTSRILVKADRNDLEAANQETIGDKFKAAVSYRPRYHVVPR